MTTANLGFAIDSSQAAGAATDLDRLTSAAARAEQAATKTSAAGTRMSRGFADLSPALEKIIGSLGRLEGITTSIDKRLDMMAQAATRTAKANLALDQSAVEASTAYKQLEASLNAVTAAQKRGDAELTKSLSAIERQRDAIARLNAELQKLRAAPPPVVPPSARPSPANSNFGNQGNVGNISAQLFDIGTTAAFMNPATVAIQQGPQIAQAFAGQSTKQALAGLGAGVMSLVSPVSLLAIGLTGAAAAAIQFGIGLIGAEDSSKKLDDALERHDDILKRLEERYGSLIESAKGYTAESSRILSFQTNSDIRGLRTSTRAAGSDFFNEAGVIRQRVWGGGDFAVAPQFRAFEDALKRLRKEAKEGRPDFEAFYDSLYRTATLDPEYAKKADELAKLVSQYREGTRALEDMERVQRRLFETIGPNGMLLSQGTASREDMGNLALFESRQAVTARRRRQAFDAQMLGINARSPQERAAAARQSAAARYDDSETAAERRARIEEAGALALAQAERQLADAQRDRAMSLDKIVADQRIEIDLIGKTGGAAEALRREYELTSQLRLEAARQGIEVDQRELDLIKERTAALGGLIDRYNQAKFSFDIGQQNSDANLSSRDRAITQTLRRYGLPEDLGGANADAIRDQLNRSEAREVISGFFTSFRESVIENGGDIGDALSDAIKNALVNALSKASEQALERMTNALVNALFGTPGGSSAQSGGALASAASSLLGGGAAPAAANSNAPLTGSGAGLAWNFWKSKGLADHQVAGILGNIKAESAFNPLAVGDGGNAFGLYQHNDRRHNLFAAIGGKSNLADELAQHKFAYSELMGPESRAWNALKGATNTREATAAFAGFERPSGFSWGNPEASHNFIGRLNGAEEALSKFGGTTATATAGLGQLGTGLGSVGQSLSSAATQGASGGGGGLFGWLGNLFGGGGQWGAAKAGLLKPGLFANGTSFSPGGPAWVGENGPELLDLPQGSNVVSNHKLMAALAQSGGGGGGGRTQVDVGVSVDNEGTLRAYVKNVSEATSKNNLAVYSKNQQRAGFGNDQKIFSSRKG